MKLLNKSLIVLFTTLILALLFPVDVLALEERDSANEIPYRIIPDSELTHVQFAEEWIIKNDCDPDPGNVVITFPEKWVQKSPVFLPDVKTVILRVPFWLLKDNDINKKSDEITVCFPNKYFVGMEIPPLPPAPVFDPKTLHDGDGSKMDYEER